MTFQALFLMLECHGKVHVHLVSFKTQLPEVVTQAEYSFQRIGRFLLCIEGLRFPCSVRGGLVLSCAHAVCVVSILKVGLETAST